MAGLAWGTAPSSPAAEVLSELRLGLKRVPRPGFAEGPEFRSWLCVCSTVQYFSPSRISASLPADLTG